MKVPFLIKVLSNFQISPEFHVVLFTSFSMLTVLFIQGKPHLIVIVVSQIRRCDLVSYVNR